MDPSAFSQMGFFAAPGTASEQAKWREQNARYTETTESHKVDYLTDAGFEQPNAPVSWTKVRTFDEAVEWLQQRHPEWPEDVLRIYARMRLQPDSSSSSNKAPTRPPGKPPARPFGIEHKDTIIQFD